MTVHKISTWLATGLLLLMTPNGARGQVNEWVNSPAHDLQLFAPVDFDFDNRPIGKDCGYFFHYDKLSWAFTGERVTLGQRGLIYPSEQVWEYNPGGNPPIETADPLAPQIIGGTGDQADQAGGPAGVTAPGGVPPRYDIINGVQSAPPNAKFAWGERYELGHFNGSTGWSVGILDGPEAVSTANYGFATATQPVSGDELGGTNYGGGFGSVHVNFAVPAGSGFFLGWRDYYFEQGANPTIPDTVTSGPQARNSNPADSFIPVEVLLPNPNFPFTPIPSTQFIENPNADPASTTKLADGIVDDVDGDGIAGFNPITGDVDFGDLYFFNIRFDTLSVRNVSETQGIEIMQTHRLTNTHKMAKRQGNNLDVAYGVRFLRLRDSFGFSGDSSFLGHAFADTSAENQIVGPQVRAKWSSQRGRWNLGVDGRFLFGYNVQDLEQVGGIGEQLVPGGLNSSLIMQRTYFATGRQENDFSPVAELRADLSYQVTGSIAARLGYTATFVDNITRASQMVNWTLPDMGLLPGHGNQDIFINGANFGFDVIY
ncbi:MAG: BBP7 family outer membrane beta-barrel protein [Pirellulales bacterium]|nr:BBP7 family outer membrane beta-barrel protein [Pirellulales bacterium]